VYAILGGLALAALLTAALAVANGTQGIAYCTALRFGWIVPLFAGLVIGGVALLLLDSRGAGRDSIRDTSAQWACPACDNPILEDWRMCPYCGQLLSCDMSTPEVSGSSMDPIDP
jgi:hypothetical protein